MGDLANSNSPARLCVAPIIMNITIILLFALVFRKRVCITSSRVADSMILLLLLLLLCFSTAASVLLVARFRHFACTCVPYTSYTTISQYNTRRNVCLIINNNNVVLFAVVSQMNDSRVPGWPTTDRTPLRPYNIIQSASKECRLKNHPS